jgi:hypothetical protein
MDNQSVSRPDHGASAGGGMRGLSGQSGNVDVTSRTGTYSGDTDSIAALGFRGSAQHFEFWSVWCPHPVVAICLFVVMFSGSLGVVFVRVCPSVLPRRVWG